MMMSSAMYEEILNTIKSNKPLRSSQLVLEEKFPKLSALTLGSIFSNFVQRKMKADHRHHSSLAKMEELYHNYKEGVRNREEPGIILRLADDIEISPVLVARFILEAYLRERMHNCSNEDDESQTFNRSDVGRFLRYTHELSDPILAMEIYICTIHDDQYGPFPDAIKQSAGIEHEQLLKNRLQELRICFIDETILRQQGYDKTPDFKLDIPIAIGGHVINWIECKARFGDEITHQTYLDEQLLSYWNRYGPGLVIYYLGYVETLPLRTIPGILIRHDFPRESEITFYTPKELNFLPTALPTSSTPSLRTNVSAARAIKFE